MKKDLRMLLELRKGPLAGMDEDEFKMIEEDVRKFGFKGLSGYAKSMVMEAMRRMGKSINEAVAVKKKIVLSKAVSVGDKVSWNASGGSAEGRVLRIERSGKINVPDSSFEIEGTEDDPAALIVLYRDGKPTDTKVGHKVSTLKKKLDIEKHGDHDQSSHGGEGDDSEGEDSSEPKNSKPNFVPYKDDSEGEFEDLDYDDPKWMDTMDYPRKKK
jgi:hypothetical protein